MNNKFWPENKKFAFTIIDDTDNSTMENAPLIYDFLKYNGILTTKTVWTRNGDSSSVYNGVNGDTLENDAYLKWVRGLKNSGFEICLHSSTWSCSDRSQIIYSFKIFEDFFNRSSILIQHNDHKECESIYWGGKRLIFPLNLIFELMAFVNPRGVKSSIYQGENKKSKFFWGDIARKKVDYIRNLTFDEINLFNVTKYVAHKRRNTKYVKKWFISSEAPACDSFINLLKKENIDKLEKENGVCIIYTHFGNNFVSEGELNPDFKETIEYLSSKDGWFVPASDILLHLENKISTDKFSYLNELLLGLKWLSWKIFKGTS